jgi:hypothetical protein
MMTNHIEQQTLDHQGAGALLKATLGFLRCHKISKAAILQMVRESDGRRAPASIRGYRKMVRAYEQMGIVMSTWYSNPKFLDKDSRPVPISVGRGSRSVASLLKLSRVSITARDAEALMLRSPSVTKTATGSFVAVRREFILPDFEIPRAALVVERYLDTLTRNSIPRTRKTVVLLERNCHVPEVNLKTIAPILRDIKGRGSAFINSVDGDIEGERTRSPKGQPIGEMSVHIFAWTRPTRRRKSKRGEN